VTPRGTKTAQYLRSLSGGEGNKGRWDTTYQRSLQGIKREEVWQKKRAAD